MLSDKSLLRFRLLLRAVPLLFFAVLLFYLAAYPWIRAAIQPHHVEIAKIPKESNRFESGVWCVHFSGLYRIEVKVEVASAEQMTPLLKLLGSGSYAPTGAYIVVEEGIEIPIQVTVISGNRQFVPTIADTYPTVSAKSQFEARRVVGRLQLPHGCFRASIVTGDMPEGIANHETSVQLSLYRPTGPVGHRLFLLLGYSDWIVAFFYRIHLRPLFWFGFVVVLISLIKPCRRIIGAWRREPLSSA